MKNFIKTIAAGLLSILVHVTVILCGALTVFCWMSVNDCNSSWGAVGVFFCSLIITMLEFLMLHLVGQIAMGKIKMINWKTEKEDITNENQ